MVSIPKTIWPAALLFLCWTGGSAGAENHCGADTQEYEFFWRGQFAGFVVKGSFLFDAADVPANGIVREENLLKLDVSFYAPNGTLLRTYEDNHKNPTDDEGKPYLNFAFDVHAEEIFQDGTWNVDDNELKYRNGFMMGEGKPSQRKENGSQEGLAFWSRPSDDKTPHLHVDDWNNQEGVGQYEFPIGFSSHEDASFHYQTTTQRIATGKVGEAYYQENNGTVVVNKLASDLDAFGQPLRVRASYDHAMECMKALSSGGASPPAMALSLGLLWMISFYNAFL
mmetsp:Transcript_38298/g.86168  ORF Transcript_38298/g.86168 Transcript_38298/m.86168 type:complete len:282 (-) Transcript_38298:68-913(-)